MARPDAHVERHLAAFADDVRHALGDELVCVALYGSAAGEDWVPGASDLNTVVVVPRVTLDVLERLAPVVARARSNGVVPPAVMDDEYLAGARDTFPIELDDIRRQHRVLAGRDVFADLAVVPDAVRRQCEREARENLLRLRARFLAVAGDAEAVDQLMVASVKSFTILLRHLLRLRRQDAPQAYAAVIDAGAALLGPLPAMRTVLARRSADGTRAPAEVRATFAAYLGEVERIVAAVDALDA
jgi:hypothetical protein